MSTPYPVAPSGCIRDRVFVSYSHLDAQWLDKLREFLHPDIRNGRIDYRDDHNLAPGEKWYEELAGYIAHARVAVLLVSPNFLASDFIREKELPLILEAEKQGLTILWVPLSGAFYGPDALPGSERVTRYQAVWDANQPLDAAPEESKRQHLLDLCKLIARLVGAARPPNNLPFAPLGNLLKGREDDLERLDEQLRQHGSSAIVQPQAVSGPGGIGKTRLAVEYARRHEGDFTALLFVSAGSPSDLDANIARLCAADGALDLTEYKSASQDDQYSAVIRWLQQNKGWLLILDNVDTREAADAVKKLAARLTGGHVLITSRITMWSGGIPRFPLDVLSPEAAVALLIDKANSLPRTPRPDDAQQARVLAEQLGYLPLALTHAAAYIGESDLAFEDYLKEFDDALQSDEHDPIGYDSNLENAKILKTVATTYFLSTDRLGPVEKAILRAACFLAPAPISIAMFADCPDEMKALVDLWCGETGEPSDTKPVRDAVKELVRYSLIERNAETFTIHRMERLVLAHRVHKDHEDRVPNWIEATRAALIRYAPEETAENPTTWLEWDVLRPHAEAMVESAKADGRIEPNLQLLISLGQLYFGKGLYDRNLGVDKSALELAEQTDGPESDEVASRQLAYGETLRVLGRYAEAEAAFRKSLEITERSNSSTRLSVASVLNYVALAVGAQGRPEEAEVLLRKALALHESSPNEDMYGFFKVANNLGALLFRRGELDECEELAVKSRALAEEAYGAEHPQMMRARYNLARLRWRRGDLLSAETQIRNVVEKAERVLGPDHPDTLSWTRGLAVVLNSKGEGASAELLLRRVLEGRERALGPNHPDTIESLDELAGQIEANGRAEEAAPLSQRVIEGQERALGAEHPDMLKTWNNHSFSLRKSGLFSQAEPIDRHVVATTAKVLGATNPLTLHRRNNLVLTLVLLDKLAEARALLHENWQVKAESFANTTPRIAFLAFVIALLEARPGTPFLGQLKTLLNGPELPVTPGITVPWDIAYFIAHLSPQLPSGSADFLTALVAAMNDGANLGALDSFAEWRDQAPVPLDALWPSD